MREKVSAIEQALLIRVQHLEQWIKDHEREGMEYGNDFEDRDKKILNMIADLSLRINKMQSSLREFEKQRIDPQFQHVWIAIRELHKKV